MGKEKSVNIRVDSTWIESLQHVLHRIGLPQRHRSRFIRDLVLNEYYRWFSESYYCQKCDCYTLVLADGAMVHWVIQKIYLISERRFLPSGIFMKPEKKNYFEFIFRNDDNPGKKIRDAWMMNYFSAWKRGDIGYSDEDRISALVDRYGITAKWVDLPIHRERNSVITREILVGICDYAHNRLQQKGSGGQKVWELGDDRADLLVDMPMLNLSFWVLVDLDLYRNHSDLRNTAEVRYEIRNREFARLRDRTWSSSWNPISCSSGRNAGRGSRISDNQDVVRVYREMERRVKYIASGSTAADDGLPVVDNESTRDRLSSLRIPQEFIYGHLTWPVPHPGMVVSLSWNKPYSQ